MLTDYMVRQEDVKDLLHQVREVEDKTTAIAMAAKLGYPDEVVVALILAQLENSEEPERDVVIPDLIWAGAILDHLDTQGFVIHQKKVRKVKKNG